MRLPFVPLVGRKAKLFSPETGEIQTVGGGEIQSAVTAHSEWLRKLRTAMGDRDERYRLRGLVEVVDDAFIGGKRSGKRGRGAAGKTPVLVAVEHRGKGAGFLAVNHQQLTQCLEPTATVRSDAYSALNILAQHCQQQAQVTTPQQAGPWCTS